MPMKDKNLSKALNSLEIKGLSKFIILTASQKAYIKRHEELINKGVLEALKRRFTVCCTHDSIFRKPAGKIVKKTKQGLVFPPVPFPEFEKIKIGNRYAKSVVSGSPGINIDSYLRRIYKRRGVHLERDEATLLIGID